MFAGLISNTIRAGQRTCLGRPVRARTIFLVALLIGTQISCGSGDETANKSGNNGNGNDPGNGDDTGNNTELPASPTITFNVNPAIINSGDSTTLTWTSRDATSCTASGAWSGDKTTAGDESRSNVMQTQTYTLMCSGAGGSSSQSVTVTVNAAVNISPTAAFTATPLGGPAPLRVAVDASASGDSDGTLESFDWSFGDGAATTGLMGEHTYTQPGQYTLTLTVRDNDGAEDTATRVIQATDVSGTSLLSLDYEEEDWNLVFRKPNDSGGWDLGDFYYGSYGWAGSNAFKFVFNGQQTQNDTGWPLINGLPPNTYNHIFVGQLIKLSADFIAKIELGRTAGGIENKWQSGVFAWNADGTDAEFSSRQVSFLRGLNGDVWYGPYMGTPATGGVGFTLVDGGAGYPYGWAPQEVEPAWQEKFFDFNAYADQWVWVVHEYDYTRAATSLHYVTRDGEYSSPNGSTPYLRRTWWVDENWTYGSYVRDLRWWAGYWKTESLTIAPGETVELTIDHFRVSTVWIDPPAGFLQ